MYIFRQNEAININDNEFFNPEIFFKFKIHIEVVTFKFTTKVFLVVNLKTHYFYVFF